MSGSGERVNYQIRQGKSIERKMLCDLIRKFQIICGITDFRYIGMGAKYFEDFILFHNQFGINDMISIEADVDKKERFDSNKPLRGIQMKYGKTNQILPQIENFEEKMNIVWLDYDGAFSDEILEDVGSICKKIMKGSMFFISCNYSYGGQSTSEKEQSFKETVGRFFREDISLKYTRNGIAKIIRMIFTDEIEKNLKWRNDLFGENLKYKQLIYLTYNDGSPMLTLGGIFVDETLEKELEDSNIFDEFDFVSKDDKEFKIEIPKLTYKEMQFILQEMPLTDEEYNKEKFHGITLDEINKFRKIYRYYPYFTEGKMNT